MFTTGLLDEVQALLNQGYGGNLPTMSAIGYREVVAILHGEMSEAEAKVSMRRQTRSFVRRQANWFKSDDPSITWFDAGKAQVADDVEAHIRAWQTIAS